MIDLQKFYTLGDLVDYVGGIDNFRVFAKPDKFCGFCFASPSDDWVECKIDNNQPELYTLEHGYKVELVPATEEDSLKYAGRMYYQGDLLSLIKEGIYVLKVYPEQHIEHKSCIEPLCGDAYLLHEWDEVVE